VNKIWTTWYTKVQTRARDTKWTDKPYSHHLSE